ncbi:hypothetical protein EJ04DRAFT_514939 [Polyplosphaeria fusca]|uniref:Uncharacterized protein n=1 Tax=Polyplosphaeria fusca TaxID=682080 RepID=A0A9P4QQL5_9PLEO|nr:hypothetical protein EJ04DRAFT_514939 [Polyplosphaeria fusca]
MKQQILCTLPLLLSSVVALPAPRRMRREVPQEQSHKNILDQVKTALDLNNPDEIVDPVFGLLGAAAGIEGAGKIEDADCLQQATADQAFTNAKEAGDVDLMTAALIYRALERNTGQIGLASVPCESIQAVNPEIAALQQHQDPAGEGAQDLNKQIAQELAAQIDAIGGDPLQALEASTFAPGELDDETAAGNTCNEEDDAEGCINSQGLRVDDLSEEEVQAAVEAGVGAAGLVANNSAAANESAADANENADNENANDNQQAGDENVDNNVGAGNQNVGNVPPPPPPPAGNVGGNAGIGGLNVGDLGGLNAADLAQLLNGNGNNIGNLGNLGNLGNVGNLANAGNLANILSGLGIGRRAAN